MYAMYPRYEVKLDELFTKSGNQGNTWYRGSVTFTPRYPDDYRVNQYLKITKT